MSDIEYIGRFQYSENDVVYESVMATDFMDARNQLQSLSDWDSYELKIYIRVF